MGTIPVVSCLTPGAALLSLCILHGALAMRSLTTRTGTLPTRNGGSQPPRGKTRGGARQGAPLGSAGRRAGGDHGPQVGSERESRSRAEGSAGGSAPPKSIQEQRPRSPEVADRGATPSFMKEGGSEPAAERGRPTPDGTGKERAPSSPHSRSTPSAQHPSRSPGEIRARDVVAALLTPAMRDDERCAPPGKTLPRGAGRRPSDLETRRDHELPHLSPIRRS